MNAVEIEQAITDLAEQPFDPIEFPYAFLEAFGNKETTIKRLRAGASNKSDLGGVLQTNNIHILACETGQVTQMLAALKASPATGKAKAKFILATDGKYFEAEDLNSGQTVACAFENFPDHFGFFLPLAGITTVRQISENAFDIRATSRLNRLYVELLKDNPEWGTAVRRHDMNKFMARLIFCFFAEDTDIFIGKGTFTDTISQMSERDASNTHDVIATLFRAMNTPCNERAVAGIPRWAIDFPYVNGALFSGSDEVPRFSRIARSYLLHVGNLDWTRINPDIFGSMIQAISEDEERGELGMHYTSVPNILKVLNPLFLYDLRTKLEEAGDNPRALLNLRKRIARIRIFDPACGSGNFLVIAYKEMRDIEAEINRRRGEPDRRSEIPITNFRGIELRDFPAEIARLALVIAEYQCDVLYRGLKLALAEFLPLRNDNWITCGNALRIDWLSVCPATGTGVKLQSEDLSETPIDQAEIDFENEGGETYICGNPPYVGRRNQTAQQKEEIKFVLGKKVKSSASLDYVFCWIEKAADYVLQTRCNFAFVTTNSVSQGTQIPIYWPHLFSKGLQINFAHRSFRWSNNASDNAGVTCVILGIGHPQQPKVIFDDLQRYEVAHINAYLTSSDVQVVETRSTPISPLARMNYGNLPGDGNFLTLSMSDRDRLLQENPKFERIILPLYGAKEFIRGLQRYCLWIDEDQLEFASQSEFVRCRLEGVRRIREESCDSSYNALVDRPHQFRDRNLATKLTILAPTVSSEVREYLPVAVLPGRTGTTNQAYALYDAPLWNMAILASRLHLVWIATVCGKLETRYRYSNTLGWNTFPLPILTEKNKVDLTRCAEEILLAREHHFPATIADLYDPANMPADLRAAHDRNDEVLERIYIGRRFKNDTERLDKLFDLYTKMAASAAPAKGKKRKVGANI
ncbi:class I SAM-dependent DNA methyltransferase [Enterobacter ludwigii]|uniref:site-specific DNA-methyltransferase (adenine-specific) n=1 Tax=Citrobacter freundii TaxID=546 RepID=A0AA44NID7_CITFR|nr:DNA methyltransferase [Citrobacter freundii]MBO4147996.1 class I SAM-dependent DNA methyltransferase [Enterobacter ludwigii]MCP6213839.1 class I SAM-dependent DNA methyltransferase [Klebsiella pneumoniae]HDH1526698.1 class I SAM-dependent DNA methyltransferase [Klebsiella quasipneumoniae subsp. similipneumoniae]OYQ93797.1 lactate dehydrogenase [Citrobacter freundii]OYR00457.1 lactate dehydrogenase [Citrobacter freundii]